MERPVEDIVERRLKYQGKFGRHVKTPQLTDYERRVLDADRRAMRRLSRYTTNNGTAQLVSRELRYSTRHILALLWRIEKKFELEQMANDPDYVPKKGMKR